LHKNPLTRSTSHRVDRAPLVFAIVIAFAALVAPAGPAVRPSLAAARPPTMVAGPADLSAATVESSLAAMINADRAAVGLLPLRLDSRLSAIAHERSASMAAAGQLSHIQSDGQTMVDLVRAAGITWYSLGETIGWNNYPSLSASTRVVNQGWMTSPEHVAIIRSTAFNYFGVGLSTTASGDRYWTAIFLRGPDRTAPSATMGAPMSGSYVTLASRSQVRLVTWSWTGTDLQLAVLTSGLRSFEVQRRIDGGAWVSIWTSTTRRSWSTSVSVGQRVQVRVRARDNAGNVGAWSSAVGSSA
jgi:uncharacterized protein YkwD